MSRVQIAPKDSEGLIHDIRLDRVYTHLSKLVKFPESLGFAARVQETKPLTPQEGPAQEVAVFYVTSIHPLAGKNPYPANAPLITMGTMPMENWLAADKEFRHYAELADPLRSIFAGLLSQHMKARKGFEELYA